jgi:hypothetical protein
MDAFEARMKKYSADRDDLMTPSTLNAAYICSDFGTDLDAIEPFMQELTGIVDTMKEELANETRILEGTLEPVYSEVVEENELSGGETKEDQWTNDLRSGFLTTVLTPISMPGSSSSLSTARHSSPVSPTLASGGVCMMSLTAFCEGKSDVSGCATDATNECSVCMVPTISEPTLGMPSEEK